MMEPPSMRKQSKSKLKCKWLPSTNRKNSRMKTTNLRRKSYSTMLQSVSVISMKGPTHNCLKATRTLPTTSVGVKL